MNGLNSKINDCDFLQIISDYDLVVLSETWTSKTQSTNIEIQNYLSEHIYGHKSYGIKKGRQAEGISIYYKTTFKNKITVAEKDNYGIVWLKLDQSLFDFDKNVYLCCTYIPPITSKVLKDKDFDFFEEIEKGIEKYCNLGLTYIVGDLNSRTGNLSDILEYDKHLDGDTT